jgi:hypothetical protein
VKKLRCMRSRTKASADDITTAQPYCVRKYTVVLGIFLAYL